MASYSALTVVSGTTITSAWGNNVRSSCTTTETATPASTTEGQQWARTDLDILYRYTGAAVEAFDGYGAWHSYTPVFSGTVTSFFVGNGVITGGYRYVGGRTVAFFAKFNYGTTTAYPFGDYYVTLPVAMKSGFPLEGLAGGEYFDQSPFTRYPLQMYEKSTTEAYISLQVASGTYLSSTYMQTNNPVAPAAGDWIILAGMYETAS